LLCSKGCGERGELDPHNVRCGARVTCVFVETTDPELALPVFRFEGAPPSV
jgi:hypothetical protein